MTILIINHHPRDLIGGSEIQCDLIAAELTRLGHQVIYLAVNGSQSMYDTPYRVEPASLRWGELRRLICTFRPDVIYWRFNKRKWLSSALLFRLMRVKVVFAISHINDVHKWSHKVRYDASDLRGKIRQCVQSLRPALSSRLNHVGFYFVEGVVAQLHQQTGYLPVRREIVIPNSVEMTAIPFTWPSPFVAWVGTVKASKNPEVFIELARQCGDTPCDFLMVGPISQAEYHALLSAPDLPRNVHYLGPKSYAEVNGLLRQAACVVHTGAPEGFPNIFIQAWTQGTPVVSLSYDPDALIQRHHLGYYSATLDQLRRDIATLLNDPLARHDIGKRARQFAEQHFSISANVRQLAAFFEQIC